MSRCTNEQINCLIFRAGHRNTLLLSIYLKRNKFPLDIYAKRPTTCGFLNLCDCEFRNNKQPTKICRNTFWQQVWLLLHWKMPMDIGVLLHLRWIGVRKTMRYDRMAKYISTYCILKASFIRYLMKFKISLLFRALYFCVSKLLCCSNYSLFNVGYILHRWVLEYHHEPKHDSSGHLWTLECSPSGPREEVSILKRQTSSKNDFLIKM